MALPNIMRRLFRNDGYGPLLKPEIIPFAADFASKAADAAASTEWVKDIVAAPVYIDSAGSDSNDGLTSATAVQTFAKAQQIAKELPQARASFVVAGGTYTEDVKFDLLDSNILITGDVTLNGFFQVGDSARVYLHGDYSFYVNGHIYVLSSSTLIVYCKTSITSSGVAALRVTDVSFCYFYDTVSVTVTSAIDVVLVYNCSALFFREVLTIAGTTISDSAISVARSSILRLNSGCNISGSSINNGIHVYESSSFNTSSGLQISRGAVNYYAIKIIGSSSFRISGGSSDVYGSSISGTSIVFVDSCSEFYMFNSSLTLHIEYDGLSSLWTIYNRFSFFEIGQGATLAFSVPSGKSARYHIVTYGGYVELDGTVNFGSGTTYATVESTCNGVIRIPATATLSGSPSGKRYLVDYGGQIYVSGAGQNRIPGGSAGSVSTTSYGYYN